MPAGAPFAAILLDANPANVNTPAACNIEATDLTQVAGTCHGDSRDPNSAVVDMYDCIEDDNQPATKTGVCCPNRGMPQVVQVQVQATYYIASSAFLSVIHKKFRKDAHGYMC